MMLVFTLVAILLHGMKTSGTVIVSKTLYISQRLVIQLEFGVNLWFVHLGHSLSYIFKSLCVIFHTE